MNLTCLECGKQFYSTIKKQKFCNQKCYKKHRKKNGWYHTKEFIKKVNCSNLSRCKNNHISGAKGEG
jgi:hypothetical protein